MNEVSIGSDHSPIIMSLDRPAPRRKRGNVAPREPTMVETQKLMKKPNEVEHKQLQQQHNRDKENNEPTQRNREKPTEPRNE